MILVHFPVRKGFSVRLMISLPLFEANYGEPSAAEFPFPFFLFLDSDST